MATAKQRAWRKKFASLVRSGAFRKKSRSTRRSTGKRRVYTMARRRKRTYRRRRTSRSTKLFGLSTKGLLGNFGLLGVGAAALLADDVADMIPINIPMKHVLAGYAMGGTAGAAAAFLAGSMGIANAYDLPHQKGGSQAHVFGL